MGSDRGLFGDDTVDISPYPKIFSRKFNDGDEFIIGACGDCYFGDKLEQVDYKNMFYSVPDKKDPKGKTTLKKFVKVTEADRKNPGKFLKTKFVPALKEHLDLVLDKKQEFDILIGVFDSIYLINEDWAVITIGEHGTAIGSGNMPAKAALYAMHEISKNYKTIDPTIIITTALEAAQNTSTFCRGPFDLLELS